MKRNKTFKIALGGISLALTLVFMFAGSFMPGIELTLFAIASVFTAVMIIETGVGGAAVFYLAAVLLGLMLIPNKLGIIPYAFLFGYYGILKFYIEKLRSGPAQLAAKVIFFAALLAVGFLGFKELLMGAVNIPDYPALLLIVGGIIIMLLYDWLYTQLINFYVIKVQRKGIDDFKLS